MEHKFASVDLNERYFSPQFGKKIRIENDHRLYELAEQNVHFINAESI